VKKRNKEIAQTCCKKSRWIVCRTETVVSIVSGSEVLVIILDGEDPTRNISERHTIV
jgi:hypothetical protein